MGSALGAREGFASTLLLLACAAGCGTEAPAGSSNNQVNNGPTFAGPVFGVPTNNVNDPTPQAAGATFCDALVVMKGACHECHGASTQFGAPMPLATYQDLMAPAISRPDLKVYEVVSQRIHDTVRPMPELPRMLSAGQMATLDSWIAAGAPAGADPTCAALTDNNNTAVGGTGGMPMAGEGGAGGTTEPGEFTWPEDCEEFHTFTAYQGSTSNAATVGANTETHPQFYFDIPWAGEDVQALAFRSITDNSKVLHHWIMYSSGDKFLVGWAPGKDDRGGLPDDVGMYMPNSGQLRLDVHYFNRGANTVQEKDASGVEVCITRTFRKYTATVMGLWGNATVPGGQSVDNVSSCTASVTGSEPVRIMSVSPHMHKLGTHAFLSHTPVGMPERILHDAPFDFEDQRVYPLENVNVKNGDKLKTICSYTNPGNSTVTFGQNTDNEMCFNFITYYPMGAMTCGLTL